ncbi:MAG: hypothetical protein HUJ25_07800 [Crocinitomicaceae bacterium]|nr:hypothetical protein [Crocinitomicaceae bacterium]
MKNRFNWAVSLYVLSFFLPVMTTIFEPVQTLYGWEIIFQTYAPGDDGIFSSEDWEVLYYIIAMIPNPLVLIVVVLHYLKKDLPTLKWALSIMAVLAALFWVPFFFGIIFDYFSYGYWLWLISLILIHFYANNSSFKKPAKNA